MLPSQLWAPAQQRISPEADRLRKRREHYHKTVKHTKTHKETQRDRNRAKRKQYKKSGLPPGPKRQPEPGIAGERQLDKKRMTIFRLPKRVIDGLNTLYNLPGMQSLWYDITHTSHNLKYIPQESAGLEWLKDKIKSKVDDIGWKAKMHRMVEDVESDIEAALRTALGTMGADLGDFTWHLSYLFSVGAYEQPPHVDYPWCYLDDMEKDNKKPRQRTCPTCKFRTCACPKGDRTPYSVLIPLTQHGSQLEVWESIDIIQETCSMPRPDSRTIDIELYSGFIFRGDVIHSGGYMSDEDSGNLRAHLYVYPAKGALGHYGNQTNQYDSRFGWNLTERFARSFKLTNK